jgi:hypothetical protein
MKKIIEITSIEQLMEMSSMGSGAVQVAAAPKKEEQSEALLRQYIRNKIRSIRESEQLHEQQLRSVVRELIKEAKETANPHPNTGINKLRDAFRKAKPTIKSQFQQLTSSAEQRESFIAHLLAAFVRLFEQLDAINATTEEVPTDLAEPTTAEPAELSAPDEGSLDAIEKEIDSLLEAVNIDIEDDMDIVTADEQAEKPKSQVEKDFQKKKDQESERTEFAAGLEGEITGRNQAFDAFRLTQSYFSDAYLDLADDLDKKMFKDWCLYNLDLLLSSFAEEIDPRLKKPEIGSPEGV